MKVYYFIENEQYESGWKKLTCKEVAKMEKQNLYYRLRYDSMEKHWLRIELYNGDWVAIPPTVGEYGKYVRPEAVGYTRWGEVPAEKKYDKEHIKKIRRRIEDKLRKSRAGLILRLADELGIRTD